MRWRTSPEQNRPLLGNSVGWIKVKFLSFVTSCEPRKFQTILQRNPLLAQSSVKSICSAPDSFATSSPTSGFSCSSTRGIWLATSSHRGIRLIPSLTCGILQLTRLTSTLTCCRRSNRNSLLLSSCLSPCKCTSRWTSRTIRRSCRCRNYQLMMDTSTIS